MIKHVGYYLSTGNGGKHFQKWLYYKYLHGRWVEITHQEWCHIARQVKTWTREEINVKTKKMTVNKKVQIK